MSISTQVNTDTATIFACSLNMGEKLGLSLTAVRTQTKAVWKYDAEEDIWASVRGSNRTMDKTPSCEAA
jgi:hypothetical protein